MSILEIRHEHDAETGVEVIAPQGEVDISNLSVLDQVLTDVLQRRPRRLVVDLSSVAYLDSGGVSALLRAGHRFSGQGGQLALADGNRFIRRLLQMTGIDRIFPHYDTVPAALCEARAAAPAPPPGALTASAPGTLASDEEHEREQLSPEAGSNSCGARSSWPRPTT
jgi:anti-sigma B factor antagonist